MKIQNNLKVLVVDDSKINRMVHQKLLQKLGVENQAVVNGKEAVDILGCSSYDLILMDIDMPVMNGIEATMKIRELGNRCFIAGVSTNSEVGKPEFVEAGFDDYQEKPLDKDKLLAILHKVLVNQM
ncbi:hypothetical protein ACFE04_001488 [Oxalis oulophora]